MKKKIFLLQGHPDRNSLSHALVEKYAAGARRAGHEVRIMAVRDMKFDLNLAQGYKEIQALEPDLKEFTENLLWCDHLFLAFPMWWGYLPAQLKGLLDRTFLPGTAFKFHEGKAFQEKLLKGKSVRIFMTMDTPNFWYRLRLGRPAHKMLKRQVFGFTGFNPVKITSLGWLEKAKPDVIEKWLKKAESLGQRAA